MVSAVSTGAQLRGRAWRRVAVDWKHPILRVGSDLAMMPPGGSGWSPASGDTCPVVWFTCTAPFRVCAQDPEIHLQVFELARRPLCVEGGHSSNR